MSKIIGQAKRKYKKTLAAEFGFLTLSCLVLSLWQWQSAVSFGLGFLSAFLPFGVFVAIVFFKEQSYSTGVTVFYRGEAIKFALTVVLIILCFKLFGLMNFIAFFTGFFIALILNNILPLCLGKP